MSFSSSTSDFWNNDDNDNDDNDNDDTKKKKKNQKTNTNIHRISTNGQKYTRRGPMLKRDKMPNRSLWDEKHPGLLHFQQKPTHVLLEIPIELMDGKGTEMAKRFHNRAFYYIRVVTQQHSKTLYKQLHTNHGISWEPGKIIISTEETKKKTKTIKSMNPSIALGVSYQVLEISTGIISEWILQVWSLLANSKSGYAVFEKK
jgi:hypothetical protein